MKSIAPDPRAEQQALEDFKQAYPAYANTTAIDDVRVKEYSRLDKTGHTYLDYTGGGLYADCLLTQHLSLLKGGVFGNPHSTSPSSLAATELDDQARSYVLRYFNASPEEYVVIFTQNASGALKLIGESYPFGPDSRYLLTFDNHNAVNGVREFARAKGARITYVAVLAPDLRIDAAQLQQELSDPVRGGHNLFVYPAQSNFSGVQHPLDLVTVAQSHGWEVILDAAAFVPTNRLDLSKHRPDYVTLSFYKMFGYPTGVGCLIAKKSALRNLRRPWFSGGTIEMASVQGDRYYLSENERAFEDGTINYLNIPAVELGLRFLQDVGIEKIHERVACLTGWLLGRLSTLHHKNGKGVVELYGPQDTSSRGGTLALNFRDPAGVVFGFRYVEEMASRFNISLRTGCFCNPGAGEIAFGLTKKDMVECFDNHERASFEQCVIAVKGKTAGAVRVSLGLASNFSDVYRFLSFVETFVDKAAS